VTPAHEEPYWTLDEASLHARLQSSRDGLTEREAVRRLAVWGPNRIHKAAGPTRLRVLFNQIRNPLLFILLAAAGASSMTGEWTDAAMVFTIVLVTVGIGYRREYDARMAAAALESSVRIRARVLRGGRTVRIASEELVPGDIVQLSAGSLVPADAMILESADLFLSEAVLTGESFPVEKRPGSVAASAALRDRRNCVFLGTNVRSGNATCVIVNTGLRTEFGAVAARLAMPSPETEFDRGIRRFGYLLTITMLLMTLGVFVVHAIRGRPPVETLLFSIALAVGLSPELLPAVLSVNLARGAQMMARHGVLVRRLNAIENLGSMDVLCTDKTGTLTEGVVRLEGAYDPSGFPSSDVQRWSAWNAALQTGLENPLDEAIMAAWAACSGDTPDLSGVVKRAELPFDFVRKRVSVIVDTAEGTQLITKGAFHHVTEICTRLPDGSSLDDEARARIEARYREWSEHGLRVVALALRPIDRLPAYTREVERDLTFVGFLTFLDQPKHDAKEAIDSLAALGVSIKIITGDSKAVTQYVGSLVGIRSDRVLTGSELQAVNDEALWHLADRTELFVEVDPNQKERIILALKKMGHVVGFLGDGVNDAPAMHAADTSLSVEHAVDVARQAADFVLLEHDLDVIRQGIAEGRRTFANTLKYILTTTSANMGNMISMAAASLFLPFLPLTAGQILLNNFLSDVPAVGIANDSVDHELVERPRRWDMRFIARFMVEFGALSSLFDILTFVLLLTVFHAAPAEFRTGWFVESLLTELVIALVVRTRRPFFLSRPGTLLVTSTGVLIVLTFVIPYLPGAGVFGFTPLPVPLVATIAGITALYVVSTETMKHWFYRGAS